MEKNHGTTEVVTIPYSDLVSGDRVELQTRAVLALIKESNELGLQGKRVTEVVSEPSFSVHDLKLRLKWESEP